jgi:hypothetical protein
MKAYNVLWKMSVYAQSIVEANDEEEAKEKAQKGQDYGFEENDPPNDWEIDKIEYVEDLEPEIVPEIVPKIKEGKDKL